MGGLYGIVDRPVGVRFFQLLPFVGSGISADGVASSLKDILHRLDTIALAKKAPSYIRSLLQPITACPRSMVLRSATNDELFTP